MQNSRCLRKTQTQPLVTLDQIVPSTSPAAVMYASFADLNESCVNVIRIGMGTPNVNRWKTNKLVDELQNVHNDVSSVPYYISSTNGINLTKRAQRYCKRSALTNLFVSDSDILRWHLAQQVIRSDGYTAYAFITSSYLLLLVPNIFDIVSSSMPR